MNYLLRRKRRNFFDEVKPCLARLCAQIVKKVWGMYFPLEIPNKNNNTYIYFIYKFVCKALLDAGLRRRKFFDAIDAIDRHSAKTWVIASKASTGFDAIEMAEMGGV